MIHEKELRRNGTQLSSLSSIVGTGVIRRGADSDETSRVEFHHDRYIEAAGCPRTRATRDSAAVQSHASGVQGNVNEQATEIDFSLMNRDVCYSVEDTTHEGLEDELASRTFVRVDFR